MKEFVQLNIETITWHSEQIKMKYNINTTSITNQNIEEYVDEHLKDLTKLKPPNGIIYLLVVDDNIAGMGSIKKLNEDIGEIQRMYIHPNYRGRGFGKQMLNRLLNDGKDLGCSTFRLSTPKFSKVAQHIYRSAGFVERKEYLESEVPATLRQYWIYMEKKE
jgi:ribosomal protein S18 acetylase RimI-like enzyme